MAAILSTSLAGAVTDWAAQWPLASVTGVQVGHVCAVESELAQVRQVGPGMKVTVQRGIEGTATAAHATGTPLAVYVAGDVGMVTATVSTASAGTLRQMTTSLTNTQIKALPTTGVTVLAAPGVNRVSLPVVTTMRIDATAGSYTNIHATAGLFIESPYFGTGFIPNYFNSTDGQVLTPLTAFLTSPEPNLAVYGHKFGNSAANSTGLLRMMVFDEYLSNLLNEPLSIYADNKGAGNWTGGHTANSLTVSILYSVLDITTGVFV